MTCKKQIGFLLGIALLGGTIGAWAQPKVIAHRGFWNCAGSAQNSLSSLDNAHKAGAYGSEFDVSLTSDGVAVVNHDAAFQGMEIETTPYEQLKNRRLANGEKLPTLEEYLIRGKQLGDIKLILEIKPHKRVVNEDRAVETVLALVKKYKLEKQVEYISFSMNICKELIRRAPKAHVSFLGGNVSPQDLKTLGFAGLDYHYQVFDKHPGWLDQARRLGLTVNVWTVDDPAVMRSMIERGADYITTDRPLELKKLLEEN